MACNGRTRNGVSMSIWVCRPTGPHYFYCPSPDFTTSIVSQSVTNNRCAPSCGGGGHKRKVRGHTKKISAGASRRHSAPPIGNCFRHHWKSPN